MSGFSTSSILFLRFDALLSQFDYGGIEQISLKADSSTRFKMLAHAAKKNAWEAMIVLCQQSFESRLDEEGDPAYLKAEALSCSYLLNACRFGIAHSDACDALFKHLRTLALAEIEHKEIMLFVERRQEEYYHSDVKIFEMDDLKEAALCLCLSVKRKLGLFLSPASNRILEMFVLSDIQQKLDKFESVVVNSQVHDDDTDDDVIAT